MPTPEPRRYATGRLISSLLLLIAAGLATYGAWAAYSNKVNAGSNAVQAGKINIIDNTNGDLFGSDGLNLTAGQTPLERCYTLSNTNSSDSVPVNVTLSLGVSGSGTQLRDRLRFSVERGASNGASGTGCTSFNSASTPQFLAGGANLATDGVAPSTSQGSVTGATSGAILTASNSSKLLNAITLSPGQSVPLRIRFFPTAGTTLPSSQSLDLTLSVDTVSASSGNV